MNSIIELKNNIEKMDFSQQIEVLKIIKNNNVDTSENKNGTFINLSKLDKKIIQELNEYNIYIIQQKKDIHKMEEKQNTIEERYF